MNLIKPYLFFIVATLICTQTYAQVQLLNLCAIPNFTEDKLSIDITAENFNNIASYQFAVAWDLAHYSLESITNYNENLEGYGVGSFGPVTENIPEQLELFRTLWFHPTGQFSSLEDGQVLFTVILQRISTDTDGFYGVVDPDDFAIEFIDGNFSEIDVDITGEGCSTLSFNVLTDTKDLTTESLSVHPNPASDFVQIELPKSNESYQYFITDNTGRVVFRSTGISDQIQLSKDQLGGSGLYHINVTYKENTYKETILFFN